jgi:hypothetical protein
MNSTAARLKTHWPLLLAVSLFWLALAILTYQSTRKTGGRIVYAIDDAYIHMSIAKNFSQHGVWGVTRYEFSSSSSSPLWTLLLSAVYYVTGPSDLTPFILNVLFGTLLICAVYLVLRGRGLSPPLLFITLAAIIFTAPLPALVFSGMEHILQAIFAVAFVFFAARMLSTHEGKAYDRLLLLAPLLTATRYEGAFPVAIVCALLLKRRALVRALMLGASGALPVVAFGAYSVFKGWHFLPNSILLKGHFPDLSSFEQTINFLGLSALARIEAYPHVLWPMIFSLLLCVYAYKKGLREEKSLALIFVGSCLLHMEFADGGWFYRYEAYLVVLGLMITAIFFHRLFPDALKLKRELIVPYLAAVLVSVLISYPFVDRSVNSFKAVPKATRNIFEQQYQMGLFLKMFYRDRAIAANDIGATTYYTDVRLLDLYGLGTLEVFDKKRANAFTTQTIYESAKQRGVAIAIVYDQWYTDFGGIPPQWVKVGKWTIPENIICASDTVSIYAVDPLEAIPLEQNLKAFSTLLPAEVTQTGLYKDSK